MTRLEEMRDATGRRLFSRGAIPRRRLNIPSGFHDPLPVWIVGANHRQMWLPKHPLFEGWWPWRRQDVSWEQLEGLGNAARADLARALAHGVSASQKAMVRAVQFGFHIPPGVAVDRTACKTETEATMIAAVDAFAGMDSCEDVPDDVALLVISAALSQSWDYTESDDDDPERGARLEHRLMWLCLRRGRVVTWNDWDVLGKQRGRTALQSIGTATRLVADGLRGGKDAFPKFPERFRGMLPPEGLSLPPPVTLGFFGARMEATDRRVEWCLQAVRRGGNPEPLALARAKQRRWAAILRLEIAACCLTSVALELSYNARVPLFPPELRGLVESTFPTIVLPMELPKRNGLVLRVGEVLKWMADAALVPERQLLRVTHLLAERATAYASRATIEAARARSSERAAQATSAGVRRSKSTPPSTDARGSSPPNAGMCAAQGESAMPRPSPSANASENATLSASTGAAPESSAIARRSASAPQCAGASAAPGASTMPSGNAAPGACATPSDGAGATRSVRAGAPRGAKESASPSAGASAASSARVSARRSESAPPQVGTAAASGVLEGSGVAPGLTTSHVSWDGASATTRATTSATTSAIATGLVSAAPGVGPQPAHRAEKMGMPVLALHSVPAPVMAAGRGGGCARDVPRAHVGARGAGHTPAGEGSASSPGDAARERVREAAGGRGSTARSGAPDSNADEGRTVRDHHASIDEARAMSEADGEDKGGRCAMRDTVEGRGRADAARPSGQAAEQGDVTAPRDASAVRETVAPAPAVREGVAANATSVTGVAPGALAVPEAREPAVASVAAVPPSSSECAKREARPLSVVGASLVNAHELAGRFPALRDIFVALGRDNGDAGGNVPMLGVLEALAGAVRRSDPAKPQQRRTVRGGSRGGAVERLSKRVAEAEGEAKTLRQHSAAMMASLTEAHRRLDAVAAERDRARSACDNARADVERAVADRDRARDDVRRAIDDRDCARGMLRRGREGDAGGEIRPAKRRRGGGGGCGPGWRGPRWDDRHDDDGAWC